MSDTNIIREFLVRLGFKVDENSRKKFEDGVQGATVSATKLATAVAAASLAVGKMVASVSKDFEDLYFSAKKAGSSAESMQALGQAAESFGVSAGQAKASAHSLFMTLQKNPGTEGIFKSLGIQTRDAKGQLLDTEKLMMGFFAKAKKMPSYLAYQYGGMLGISDDMLQAGMQDGFSEKELQRRLQAGAANSAANSGHNEQEQIRDAQAKYLELLQKTNEQLPPFVKSIGEALGVISSFFSSPVIVAALAALGLKNALPGGKPPAVPDAPAGGGGGGGLLATAGRWLARMGVGLSLATYSESLNADEDAKLKKMWAEEDAKRGKGWNLPDTGAGGGRGFVNPMQVTPREFFERMGWTSEQASGIAANLMAESGMNPGARGDGGKAYGIAQWHPDRQAAFQKWAGKSIVGSSAEEQMAFVNYELTQGAERKAGALLRAAQNAQDAGSIVSRYYERPMRADEEARRRGASAVQIAQTTTINVNGASDPVSTAQAVAAAQNSVNAATMRNAATRVQ